MKHLVVSPLLVLVIFVTTALAGDLPDPTLTPGAVMSEVTQDNIHQTICKKATPPEKTWSKAHRPPVSYTNKLKGEQLDQYGYEDKEPAHYEEDHLVPLSIGGDPKSPQNLWPEPWDGQWGAHTQDRLETLMFRAVCSEYLTLQEAQTILRTDWIQGYHRFFGEE